MTEKTVHEAVWTLIQSFQETNQAITESVVASQERNRKLAESFFVMHDMREQEVDILTIGQYLRPSFQHLPIQRYVPLEEFAALKAEGKKMGFVMWSLDHSCAVPITRTNKRMGQAGRGDSYEIVSHISEYVADNHDKGVIPMSCP